MAGKIGNIGRFDDKGETWESYIERLEITVSTLLTVMGLKMYNLLKNLFVPDKPTSNKFDEIIQLVQKHVSPKPSVITERYKFSLRIQREN